MKLNIISILAEASVVSGLIVDRSLPNGVYTMGQRTDTLQKQIKYPMSIHRRKCIGRNCLEYSPTTSYGKFLKDRMPFPHGHKAFCYSNETIATTDFHQALNLLFQSPLFWIPKQSVRFAIYGDAVAYICNTMDWNIGSLIEYMEAMRLIDESCPNADPNTQTPAKLGVPKYEIFYGREIRGKAICRFETDAGGIPNELQNVEAFGCKEYTNGMIDTSKMSFTNRCHHAAEKGYWDRIKVAFPWYNH